MNIIKKIGAALIVVLLLCFNSVAYAYNGIDISSYQNVTDYNKIKASGIDYIYVKSTQSNTYINPKMNSQYNGCKSADIKVGFYHYMSEYVNPSTQAEFFYNKIKNYSYNLMPCLDIETNVRGLSSQYISNRVIEFCNRFKQLSNQDILIYTGSCYERSYFNSTVINNYQMWIAQYYDLQSPTVARGTKLLGYQATDRAYISGVGYVDADYFTSAIEINNNSTSTIQSNTVNYSANNNYVLTAKNYLGNNAKRIQYLLNSCGYNIVTDGVIGQNTATAIGNFQSSSGLTKDYMFGNNSKLAAYNKLKYKTCGLAYKTPEQTKYIQYVLKQKGFYSGNIDGVYWKGTEKAVIKFQSYYGLVQDGVVGPKTWYYLIM